MPDIQFRLAASVIQRLAAENRELKWEIIMVQFLKRSFSILKVGLSVRSALLINLVLNLHNDSYNNFSNYLMFVIMILRYSIKSEASL